ncbi:MAG: hypothetical protein AAFQ87_18400 [Bacteroidota bacterium]
MNWPEGLPIEPTEEQLGKLIDLNWLEEGLWLQDSEVKPFILPLRSQWHVFMVFFSIRQELKLIVRRIAAYPTQKKAEQFASIFQRGIRKDARGTIKRNRYAYHICDN